MARASDFSYFHTPPMALAHRGGSLYPPNVGLENSLTAFRTAVDLGFTHLETDVHATSDGEVVAFHDDHLDRVSDKPDKGFAIDLVFSNAVSRPIDTGEAPIRFDATAWPGFYSSGSLPT